MFVLDCSVTMAWLFEDEKTESTEQLLEEIVNGRQAVVPSLWPLEVANVLLVAERRSRVTREQGAKFWELLSKLNIEVEQYSSVQMGRSIFVLARKNSLSSYDSAYLELALRRDLLLATLDQKFSVAADQAGVSLVF